jgi:hypothetical protein
VITSYPSDLFSDPGADVQKLRARLVADCVRELDDRLPPLWDTLFDKLDDVICHLADKSTHDLSCPSYCDARDMIGKHRTRLQSDFVRRVYLGAGHLLFRGMESGLRADSHLAYGNLTMSADAALEEVLATENLVSKAEHRFRRELLDMDRRLCAVMGWGGPRVGENPFGPSALCGAFRGALAALPPFELSVKLAVYKLFDRYVMDRLGDFYRSCLSEVRSDPLIGVDFGSGPASEPVAVRDPSNGIGPGVAPVPVATIRTAVVLADSLESMRLR